ncbi:MAG: helix-turn-helix domain-containing protein [Vicinamibacteria bacterium]
MRTTVVAPSPALEPFVRQFTFVEAEQQATRVLVPDGTAVAGFRFGGHACLLDERGAVRMPDASFAGVRDTARRMRTSAGGGVVLASFRAGTAAAFFRAPQHELFGDTVPLDALAPRDAVAETEERVREATDHASRVAAFEAFLLARLDASRLDPLVAEAARRVAFDPSRVRVAPLARALGLSQDRLEKRFRRAVGATPKQLASIVRLRRAVDAYRADGTLTRAAAGAGFFDQSHFNRAFRAATGLTPRAFFGAGEHC